jgi:hypothetical protein
MNVQCSCGFVIVTTAFQLTAQGQDEFGVPSDVIVDECPQSFAHETFDRPIDMGGVDEAIETEFVEPS